MSRDWLQQARRELEDATPTASDDVREAIRETAAAFAELAAADRKPDQGVVDGHLNELRQAKERADGETADRIDRALEYAESYRENMEQA